MSDAPDQAPPLALLRGVDVDGVVLEVAITDGVISAVAPELPAPPEGALVLHGAGGALLPGLHDHHLHLRSLAAELASVPAGPPEVGDEQALAAALADADRMLPEHAWIRAVRYHESVAGELDRHHLDRLVADRPLRVQHRSGGLWILNTPALEAVGEPAHADGRFFRRDRWLRNRVPHQPLDLQHVGRTLAGWGVTSVTDATPYADADELDPVLGAVRSGALPQRVTVMGAPSLDPATIPGELHAGPAKLLLTDHVSPPFGQVVEHIGRARRFGRAVAVHCVTREALALTVAALDAAGGSRPGDRVEHGAVIAPDLREEVRRLGLTVVTQPNLVAERGDDYLEIVEPDDLAHLWPCRSLLDAGISVLGGTDAPFGGPDPWALVAAAVERRSPTGQVLGDAERVDPRTALGLLLPPTGTSIEVGQPADLCLLAEPLAAVLAAPRTARVVHTVVGGRVVR